MELKEILSKLPNSPGIYLMKSAEGRVIYVGKAVSLRRRVRSYFQHDFAESPRVASMVSQVRDIEWRLAESDSQALLMESNAIKTLKPRYNVLLKDDKSYPYLRLTQEDYPRIESVRRPYHGRGEYFGPFMPGDLQGTLRLIHELFPLRYCEGSLKTKKPCIYYEMHSCLAPCLAGEVPVEQYGRIVRQVKDFLRGKKLEVLREVEKKMWAKSDSLDFEEAARLRDRMEKAKRLILQQKGAAHLRQREGEMADRPTKTQGLEQLQRACFLPKLPRVMEAFDISHFQGAQSVASMVRFRDGVPSKKDYRKFKIRTVQGIDDFASMAEVVRRRYRRLRDERQPLPDLVLIDGGKGQLHEAVKALRELGLPDLPTISLAKREEHLFIPGRAEPVILPRQSAALHLVQWIRDEAHRFAVTYHKTLRARGVRESSLDTLPSIGAKRKQALLAHFGSVASLRQADAGAIGRVPGFSGKLAQKVFALLHPPQGNP